MTTPLATFAICQSLRHMGQVGTLKDMEASHRNYLPSSSKATFPRGDRSMVPILVLLFVHVVAGAAAGFLSEDGPALSSAIFLGIVFCQTCLLGMWSGLGTTHWTVRLVGLAVGSTYLAVELGLGIAELEVEVFVLAILPCVLVTLATWIIRLFRGTLRRVEPAQTNVKEGLQFSIRHLMLLTFAVACLTTVGKLLAPTLANIDILAVVVVLGLCYVSVSLTSIWAILGTGHPVVRSFFVVVIAVIAGLLAGYVVDNGGEMFFWLSTTVLQAVLLIASLTVIRRVGYRFVARCPASP